ncbi:hypothetical protein V502_04503 [Pseudogymnoascus sp. VKM F-4520 (FW-2644)]|nr:hypothetical protein V502_04503 [Pseudogymnoascus sp. VKM F-4520 (FW-2644)]
MSVVAVAGGTGSIGRAIVEAIIAQGKYEVIVLGRNSNNELEESLGTRVISADYSDVHSLVALFEQNKIHTVVSAMSGLASPESELALIRAANQSKTTKRFIPSVFGVKYRPDQAWFPAAATKVAAMAELEKTSLEWTIICNGFFLDYWGMPKVKSYLSPTVIIIDVAAGKAAIPGLGSTPVVFTYSVDVAKYVAACLTLPKWENESYVIGTKLSWNAFVKLAEEVRASRVKFDVTYDSLDLLRSGKVTELPSHPYAYEYIPKVALQGILATFGILFEEGQFDFKPKQTVNELFPNINPISAKEMLEIGWKA